MQTLRPIAVPLCLTFALLLLPSNSSAQNGPVTLRYQFKPNQFLRYEVAHQLTVTTRFNQNADTATNSSEALKCFRIVAVDEAGSAVIEPTIERIKLNAKYGDQPAVAFDSESELEPPAQFAEIQKSVGRATMRMQISATGELLGMTPLNQAGGTAKPDPRMNFMIPLPKGPVNVGDTWKDRVSVSVMAPNSSELKEEIALQRVFRLAEVRDGLAIIETKSAPLVSMTDPKVEAQIAQMTPEGRIEFDINRGAINSQSFRLDREVIGAAGQGSKLHAQSQTTERLVPQRISFNNVSQPGQ